MRGVLPKSLRDWLVRLLPSHRSEGDNATHVGKVSGDFAPQTIVNLTQNFFPAQADVPVANNTAQAPVQQPRSQQPKPTSAEQSAVLRRLDQLIKRKPVLDFMEREFQTRMVIELEVADLNRVHLYLDAVMSDPQKVKPEFRRKR